MTAIKTIIEVEKQAEETINNARVAAQKDISAAEKKQKEALDQIDIELKENQSKQVREQKVDLSTLYKKMLSEGEIRTEAIKKSALAKSTDATRFILDLFVK